MDCSAYLNPVSEQSPSGEDLEYDAEFISIQMTLDEAGSDSMVSSEQGDQLDWAALLRDAQALMERTRDLRLASVAARASLATDGVVSLGDSLNFVAQSLKTFWADIYPQLDADDDNDPTERVNALKSLADPNGMLKELRAAVFVQAAGLGKFSLLDIRRSQGTDSSLEEDAREELKKSINAAFLSSGDSAVGKLGDSLNQAKTALGDIATTLRGNDVAEIDIPDFAPLSQLIAEFERALSPYTAKPETPAPERTDTDLTPAPSESETSATMPAATPVAAPAATAITNASMFSCREDIHSALQAAVDFVAANQPSNPLAILLERAKRFSQLSYAGVMQELYCELVEHKLAEFELSDRRGHAHVLQLAQSKTDAYWLEQLHEKASQVSKALEEFESTLDDRERIKIPRRTYASLRNLFVKLTTEAARATQDREESHSDAPEEETEASSDTPANNPFEVKSMAEVVNLIADVKRFYAGNEPGSPVLALLAKTDAYLNGSFLELSTLFSPEHANILECLLENKYEDL